MDIVRDIVSILGFALFVAFFWFVLINGIKQKKQYEEKATVKDAVIIKKSSRRQQVGARFSGKLYELEAMTDEGKKYHIETFSYRVRFYKEGQNVKIIVPNNLKEYVLSDEKVLYSNDVILKIDKDTNLTIILGFIVTLLFTLLLGIAIIAVIVEIIKYGF